MTTIEQIEKLAVEARARGMTYGKYVGTLPIPKPKKKPKPKMYEEVDQYGNLKRDVVCAMCGTTFTAYHGRTKFCLECKKEKARIRAREQTKRRREERKRRKSGE